MIPILSIHLALYYTSVYTDKTPRYRPMLSIPATKNKLASPNTSGMTSVTEEKAINLLGAGVSADSVASAIGVTPSRISQLLSDEVFAVKVSEIKYNNLQKHNVRDDKYDTLEDKLLVKLERSLPLLVKPEAILNAVKIVNSANRRGQAGNTSVGAAKNIVNLVLPTTIAQKFVTNINNQVVKAGEQELLTIPSGDLLKQLEEVRETQELEE